MRTPRNPRYAPESLERKLSPSGVVSNYHTAEVYSPPAPPPPPPPPLYPGPMPTVPTGPTGPAYTE